MGYSELKFGKAQRKRRGFYYICESCQREFYVTPARVRDTEKQGIRIRFCSKECYAKAKIGDGNPFWGKKHTKQAIAKMIAHPNRRYFSAGKDNPNYLKYGDVPHKDSTSKRWRRYLMAKRGVKCEHCGYDKFSEIIEIHHIDCNPKNNVDDNFLLLCPTCHEETHFIAGTGKYAKGKDRATPNPITHIRTRSKRPPQPKWSLIAQSSSPSS